ncbi:hypothetical protein [Streptomyces sp. NPDC091217]|uniref:hypothetical protein n=1 Tax=Streptomyces sp. NPDC091217 TaxID=3365975 RepID=UPI00380A547B
MVVALYLSVWRDRRWRADLKVLDFDQNRIGDQIEVLAPDNTSLWVRLPVINSPHHRTAHDAEVTLESIEPADGPVPGDELLMRLAGSAGRQLKWADRADRTMSIHPGAIRRFDLFHVRAFPAGDQDYCRLTFRDPGHREDGHPLGWRGVIPVGSYRVVFSIEAADIDSRQFSCVITWHGGLDIDVSPVARLN